ncbi:Hrf1 family protein [Necator americanus]|uniref:Protein YIF1 n=1 Tax=Necator americanus TaxID=51031 RepID=W2TMM0_NECAM|nr:Hrf1 family protein [Necator americanus]ETN82381.1 Hrf1 family protein [Necator americanus]
MSNDWDNDWSDTPQAGKQQGFHQQQQQHQYQSYGGYSENQGQGYYQHQYHGQPTIPQQQNYNNYYSQPNSNAGFGFNAQSFMADPMMQAAQQFGGQFAEQQKESAFNLKYYFTVDNSYVGKKLGILLFPFIHSDWSLKYGGGEDPVPAKEDVNAPDLYIPLMAFITYILVSGFVLGTQGRFSPEMLGILTSNAFIWIIIENIIIFVSKYVLNISQSLSVWHSLAYSTYKFVGMIICLLMFMAGGKSSYYCALAYTSLALVFFLLRTVKNFIFDSHHFGGEDGRKRKLTLILFILVSQPLIMWWLTSGVTSFEYGKYSFAQMAMGKMGMGDVKAQDIPLTADGDVDYEALLKMPQ